MKTYLWLVLFVLLFSLPAALAEEEQPVLYLPFNGTVQDASPHHLHGKTNREAVYTEGVNGQALKLDGRTYIDLAHPGCCSRRS